MKGKVTIKYCTSWGYLGRAVGLARKILNEFKNEIKEVSLMPGMGGVYEISFEDKIIHSKKETGEYPENDDIISALREMI